MNKKYELTNTCLIINGVKYFQIRALRDFGNIKAGTIGAWIEGEYNLSQQGTCWASRGVTLHGLDWISNDTQIIHNTDELYASFPLDRNISGAESEINFDFLSLAHNVSEITIDNIKYIKKTTWAKQN